MAKAFGINELLNHTFKYRTLSEVWQRHLGEIESNCFVLIQGPAKNGKTDYCMKFTKELCKNGGRVFYNSCEEGKSGTLKATVKRNNMQDVVGKVTFGNREPFEEMMVRMKGRGAANTLVIDSWDYMHLMEKQFQRMRKELKNKMIIIICWADGDRPDNNQAKKIEHHADVIVRVRNFKAMPVSRFGGNEIMVIRKQTAGQGELFS